MPLLYGNYTWANGKCVERPDATIVAVHTNLNGIIGYGEVVPLGTNYLASYASGVRVGLKVLCPKLVGQDPTRIKVINDFMDFHLKGHPYVKSPIDMACWDILGKVSGLPLCILLGGNYSDEVQLSRSISQGTAQEMADHIQAYKDQGYSRFQLKLGRDVFEDIKRIKACHAVLSPGNTLVGDANGEYLTHQALQVAKATENLTSFYLENPCQSYEENLTVRKHSNLPLVLDEIVMDLSSLVRAWHDHSVDMVNIKISKFGGITKAKEAIEFCINMGIAMVIEDTWGGDITTSAILALASIIPPKLLFAATDLNSYNTLKTGYFLASDLDGVRSKEGHKMTVPRSQPGLGVEPNWKIFEGYLVSSGATKTKFERSENRASLFDRREDESSLTSYCKTRIR